MQVVASSTASDQLQDVLVHTYRPPINVTSSPKVVQGGTVMSSPRLEAADGGIVRSSPQQASVRSSPAQVSVASSPRGVRSLANRGYVQSSSSSASSRSSDIKRARADAALKAVEAARLSPRRMKTHGGLRMALRRCRRRGPKTPACHSSRKLCHR